MADKIKVSEIRSKFPMYGDVSDENLVLAVRKKFYDDIPLAQFVSSIDFDTDRAKYSPAGDSFFGNIPAAAGAGMSSIGRAVGLGPLLEKFGLPSTKEDAARLDAPLDAAPGGTTGRVLGAATLLAPTAMIPGAGSLMGASAIGAGTGLATTEGGIEDRLKGAAWGAGGGATGNLLGRGIGATVGAVRGLIEPFTQGGRDRIAAETLRRFSTNPRAATSAQTGPSVTGANPTFAEAARDPGLATLERALGTLDPQAAAATAARQEANNAARLDALRVLSGGSTAQPSRVGRLNRIVNSQPTREVAETARRTDAAASYGAARARGVDAPMSEALTPQIESLMARPSVQSAIAEARGLAREEGIDLADMGSAQGLQYVKQAIDDQIGRLAPKEANRARLLTQTSNDLKSVLDEIAPALRQADAEFAMNSVPVNRAAIGERLLEKTTGAIRDFAGNRRLQANRFSGALNDEEALLKNATGFNGYSNLDDILTPAQSQRVNAVRGELETVANLSNAVSGGQSQTAKMLASQNLARRVAGPLGLPDSWISSTIAQEFMRAPQFFVRTAEERIQQSISQGLLNPAEGQRLLGIAMNAQSATPSELLKLGRAVPGLLGYSLSQVNQ